MRQYRRTRKVVDRSLQYKMTGVFLLGVLIALILFTASMIGYYWLRAVVNPSEQFITVRTSVQKEEQVEENGEIKMEKYMVSEESPPLRPYEFLTPIILLNNLIILIVLGVLGILFSHRVAGPMYNINRALDLALKGDLRREIKLRKGDFFHDTAERLNKILPINKGPEISGVIKKDE